MTHYPVMLPEVLGAIAPQVGEVCVDGTFGNGGYTTALLEASDCHVIAIDRDPTVRPRIDALKEQFGTRLTFIEAPFSRMNASGIDGPVDAVVLDIGVSSMQIDQAERGFSFMRNGPLDMRMSRDGVSAADAVNHLSKRDLARVFKVYGEERKAERIATWIVRARDEGHIVTTEHLAELIENAIGRQGKIHPATRVFQALRIFINDELGELYRGLCAAERLLAPGGRLVVVTFHSLEDRIVKQFLVRRAGGLPSGSRHLPDINHNTRPASFTLSKKQALKPRAEELSENPRSRSAKLRCGVRTDAAPFPNDDDVLPRVPTLGDLEALL